MHEQKTDLGDVIPAPAEVRPDPDADFTIHSGTGVRAAPGTEAIAEYLATALRAATGHPIPVSAATGDPMTVSAATGDPMTGSAATGDPASAVPTRGSILLDLAGDGPEEAYELTITPVGVTLRAAARSGLFAGVQTLIQLMPVAPAAGAPRGRTAGRGDVILPGGRIADRPRFSYRGVMLDVARHFFTPDEVKSYIDAIAAFKINHLHLHLTDDQGWRIEIKSWPELTTVSGGAGTGVDGAGPGYYSQDEYADLVAYASARFVTVVPEIDMPGHVNAAQVAYPELTADGIAALPRTDIKVGYSSLVVEKEETYAFIDDVVRELAALTPGPYLHVGGDEADATLPEDYRTFMNRVLPIVTRYGKRPIGWHEVATADLPPEAVPQYWRIEPADDGVARAAARGNKVIMSPADRTYLDMKYEADSSLGLDWAGLLPLERAYRWDPADRLPGVAEEALLGVEAALWGETLRSIVDVQMMTFPRLPAIAEIGWTPRSARDWESFRRRLGGYGPRWDAQGVAYYPVPEVDWR